MKKRLVLRHQQNVTKYLDFFKVKTKTPHCMTFRYSLVRLFFCRYNRLLDLMNRCTSLISDDFFYRVGYSIAIPSFSQGNVLLSVNLCWPEIVDEVGKLFFGEMVLMNSVSHDEQHKFSPGWITSKLDMNMKLKASYRWCIGKCPYK